VRRIKILFHFGKKFMPVLYESANFNEKTDGGRIKRPACQEPAAGNAAQ